MLLCVLSFRYADLGIKNKDAMWAFAVIFAILAAGPRLANACGLVAECMIHIVCIMAIMIPFIIGIIWMFASGASFASKLFTALSVILIVASIILNTNIYMVSISMYEWVIMLVLIFGGAGFVAKVLFSDAYKEEKHKGKKKDAAGRYNHFLG